MNKRCVFFLRDLCSGLECLFEHGIYPIQITAKDIYVKKVGKNALAQLLIEEGTYPYIMHFLLLCSLEEISYCNTFLTELVYLQSSFHAMIEFLSKICLCS